MRYSIFFCLIFLTLICGITSHSRETYQGKPLELLKISGNDPYMTLAVHNSGTMALTVTNFGLIGTAGQDFVDPITGLAAPSLSYPDGYGLNYLSAATLWIGALAGPDTLVSNGNETSAADLNEFYPLPYPEGDIIYRSTNNPEAPEYEGAFSSQDFISTYYDTFSLLGGVNFMTGERHNPMGLMVTQRSYSWGYDYAEDFIIFDFSIVNIGDKNLEDVYIGLYVDNDCDRDNVYPASDDICGFLKSYPSQYIDGLVDTINVAWAADNDADPNEGGTIQGDRAPSSVIGTRILRTPSDSLRFSFNWWATNYYYPSLDWGPRKQTVTQDPVRTFYGRLGTPITDADKYYVMSQEEFDYNQEFMIYDHSQLGWLPPPQQAASIANGADIRYLLSCGPYSFKKGTELPFTFAIIGGRHFYDQNVLINPFGYTKWRDPSDLALNSVWASWVYDNPGFDTDGDGTRGKYYIKVYDSIFDPNHNEWVYTYAETLYYRGDGVPDFRGASPPPPPVIELHPRITAANNGEIEIRWNGRISETSLDQFSQRPDWEGYRVYISISDRDDDFVLVTSYDLENYNRWEYNTGGYFWEIREQPYDIRTLKAIRSSSIPGAGGSCGRASGS